MENYHEPGSMDNFCGHSLCGARGVEKETRAWNGGSQQTTILLPLEARMSLRRMQPRQRTFVELYRDASKHRGIDLRYPETAGLQVRPLRRVTKHVQVPHNPSYELAAVRVVQLKYVWEPAEILAASETDQLPVPYASQLNENSYSNDGLITFAEATYRTIGDRAAGHAYLIVGYRKLP